MKSAFQAELLASIESRISKDHETIVASVFSNRWTIKRYTTILRKQQLAAGSHVSSNKFAVREGEQRNEADNALLGEINPSYFLPAASASLPLPRLIAYFFTDLSSVTHRD